MLFIFTEVKYNPNEIRNKYFPRFSQVEYTEKFRGILLPVAGKEIYLYDFDTKTRTSKFDSLKSFKSTLLTRFTNSNNQAYPHLSPEISTQNKNSFKLNIKLEGIQIDSFAILVFGYANKLTAREIKRREITLITLPK